MDNKTKFAALGTSALTFTSAPVLAQQAQGPQAPQLVTDTVGQVSATITAIGGIAGAAVVVALVVLGITRALKIARKVTAN